MVEEKLQRLLQIAWTKSLGTILVLFIEEYFFDCYFFTFLSAHYRSKLKEHMQYCVDHPEEISKLAKVKAQVSEVKGVMMENIEKVRSKLLLHT